MTASDVIKSVHSFGDCVSFFVSVPTMGTYTRNKVGMDASSDRELLALV